MWKLVSLSLAYHLKALLVAWVIALLLSKLGLVILAIVSVYLISAEDKERRLLLQLPQPVTRLQVGLARVVFPAVVFLLGTVAAALVSYAVLDALLALVASAIPAAGGVAVGEAVWDLLIFATVLMFFSQLLLLLGELNVWGTGHGLPRLLVASLSLLLVLILALLAWLAMASYGSYPVLVLGTAGLALVLMGITVALFERRPSFTSG